MLDCVLILIVAVGMMIAFWEWRKFKQKIFVFFKNWDEKFPSLNAMQNRIQTIQTQVGILEQGLIQLKQVREEIWAKGQKIYPPLLKKFLLMEKSLQEILPKVFSESQKACQNFQTISEENTSRFSREIAERQSELFPILEKQLQSIATRCDQVLSLFSTVLTEIKKLEETTIQQNQDNQSSFHEIWQTMQEESVQQHKNMSDFLCAVELQYKTLISQVREQENLLQPFVTQLQEWQRNPIVKLKDLQRKKVAVFVDFENFFISLWDKELEIFDFEMFKTGLVDIERSGGYIADRIIFFTNKSRWQRKEFYDKKKNISQRDANAIKDALKEHGFRVIETDSNIDVPLSLMVMAIAQKGELKEFILVANDGTYSGLLKELSNMGCMVSGILVGEPSGDLISCYKKLGYHRIHLKTREDFANFGMRSKTPSTKKMLSSVISSPTSLDKIQSLLAWVHKQRMQFLGTMLQDLVLVNIHKVMLSKSMISRSDLVDCLVKQLDSHIENGSLTKTKINNILNIIWKTQCFQIIKQENETILLRLNPDYTEYNAFRSAHDAIFVKIALDANIFLTPIEFSQLLYGTIQIPSTLSKVLENIPTKEQSSLFLETDSVDKETSENSTDSAEDVHFSGDYAEIHAKILACIRRDKMQFIGTKQQEQILHSLHQFLSKRKLILRSQYLRALEVYFAEQISQGILSKTKIVGLNSILRKNRTILVSKDENDNPYIKLASGYQEYEIFRKAHDEVFVRTCLGFDLDVCPEAWSSLLYGDLDHTAYFVQIIKEQKENLLLHPNQDSPEAEF